MVHKLKIVVLRFGTDSSSMRSGDFVIKNLSDDKYIVSDVIVSTNNDWYLNGVRVVPERFLKNVDLVFNLLSDDLFTVKLLETFKVDFVGPDFFSANLSKNHYLLKNIYKKGGLKSPYFEVLRKDTYDSGKLLNLFRSIPMPCVVKSQGSKSVFVDNLKDLERAVSESFSFSDLIIVEEFVRGMKVSCHVVDRFRNQSCYTTLPQDIDAFCVAVLGDKEKREIQKISVDVHNEIGLKHYSRSDFVVTKNRGVYILKTNYSLDFNDESLLRKSMVDVGIEAEEFLDHLVCCHR